MNSFELIAAVILESRSSEVGRLPAAHIPAVVLGVSGVQGVQGSPMNHKKLNQLLPCYASAIGIDAGNKSVTYTTGSHPFRGGDR